MYDPRDFGFGKYSLIYNILSFLSIPLLNNSLYPFHLTYSLSTFLLINFSILNSFGFGF